MVLILFYFLSFILLSLGSGEVDRRVRKGRENIIFYFTKAIASEE